MMPCVELPRLLKRQQAECVVGVPTMVLSETLACSQVLQLCWVIRGGIGSLVRLLQPNLLKDTHPRTLSASRHGDRRHGVPLWLLRLCAQAACAFSLVRSKRSPFFQMVRAMAAILRARVSCAISGWMPARSRSW